jgi:hypothetical protein
MPRGKPFVKGEAKGRPLGVKNHLTRTVKETVLAVFNTMQDDPKVNLLEFGKKYPRDFYAIAAKLIPSEIQANVEIVTRELPPFMKSNDSKS